MTMAYVYSNEKNRWSHKWTMANNLCLLRKLSDLSMISIEQKRTVIVKYVKIKFEL